MGAEKANHWQRQAGAGASSLGLQIHIQRASNGLNEGDCCVHIKAE
jgi:hypothetical protein